MFSAYEYNPKDKDPEKWGRDKAKLTVHDLFPCASYLRPAFLIEWTDASWDLLIGDQIEYSKVQPSASFQKFRQYYLDKIATPQRVWKQALCTHYWPRDIRRVENFILVGNAIKLPARTAEDTYRGFVDMKYLLFDMGWQSTDHRPARGPEYNYIKTQRCGGASLVDKENAKEMFSKIFANLSPHSFSPHGNQTDCPTGQQPSNPQRAAETPGYINVITSRLFPDVRTRAPSHGNTLTEPPPPHIGRLDTEPFARLALGMPPKKGTSSTNRPTVQRFQDADEDDPFEDPYASCRVEQAQVISRQEQQRVTGADVHYITNGPLSMIITHINNFSHVEREARDLHGASYTIFNLAHNSPRYQYEVELFYAKWKALYKKVYDDEYTAADLQLLRDRRKAELSNVVFNTGNATLDRLVNQGNGYWIKSTRNLPPAERNLLATEFALIDKEARDINLYTAPRGSPEYERRYNELLVAFNAYEEKVRQCTAPPVVVLESSNGYNPNPIMPPGYDPVEELRRIRYASIERDQDQRRREMGDQRLEQHRLRLRGMEKEQLEREHLRLREMENDVARHMSYATPSAIESYQSQRRREMEGERMEQDNALALQIQREDALRNAHATISSIMKASDVHELHAQEKEKNKKADDEDICYICYGDSPCWAPSCGHVACKSCVDKLMHQNCPKCRQKITFSIKIFL